MRADLVSILENEYSFMKNVYVETGDGWYQIVYHMCREINNVYSKYDLKPDIIVDYIKQKNGELVFMYHYNTDSNIEDKTYQLEIDNIVAEYERQALEICEECGKSGELRCIDDWLTVLCEECFEKEV